MTSLSLDGLNMYVFPCVMPGGSLSVNVTAKARNCTILGKPAHALCSPQALLCHLSAHNVFECTTYVIMMLGIHPLAYQGCRLDLEQYALTSKGHPLLPLMMS
jgi:hypothetical protein